MSIPNNITTLNQGTRYDRSTLTFSGWTAPDPKNCTPDVVEGYHPDFYFDASGTYKGPDEFGVEPTFRDHEA